MKGPFYENIFHKFWIFAYVMPSYVQSSVVSVASHIEIFSFHLINSSEFVFKHWGNTVWGRSYPQAKSITSDVYDWFQRCQERFFFIILPSPPSLTHHGHLPYSSLKSDLPWCTMHLPMGRVGSGRPQVWGLIYAHPQKLEQGSLLLGKG